MDPTKYNSMIDILARTASNYDERVNGRPIQFGGVNAYTQGDVNLNIGLDGILNGAVDAITGAGRPRGFVSTDRLADQFVDIADDVFVNPRTGRPDPDRRVFIPGFSGTLDATGQPFTFVADRAMTVREFEQSYLTQLQQQTGVDLSEAHAVFEAEISSRGFGPQTIPPLAAPAPSAPERATTETPAPEPTLEFRQDTLVNLSSEAFASLSLNQKVTELLTVELVVPNGETGVAPFTPAQRAEAVVRVLNGHIVTAGEAAAAAVTEASLTDGQTLEEARAAASGQARQAALEEVGGVLGRLDARQQQNLQLLLREDGIDLSGLDEGVQSRLQAVRDAALAADGRTRTPAGQEMNFLQMILVMFAELLPEDSEMRRNIMSMVDGEGRPAAAPAVDPAAPEQPAAATSPERPAAVDEIPAGAERRAFLQSLDPQGYAAVLAAPAGTTGETLSVDQQLALHDQIVIRNIEAELSDLPAADGKVRDNGVLEKSELELYAQTHAQGENPALDALLAQAGIERQSLQAASVDGAPEGIAAAGQAEQRDLEILDR